jgi:hypothetical protein
MLTAAEYHMRETLPIFRIQEAIFEFCRGQPDIAIFGAHAVNLYVADARMTQDVDILCLNPAAVAAALARRLGELFQVTVRVREFRPGLSYRVFQLRAEGNRHLADTRLAEFPLTDVVEQDGIRYVGLALLTALKVMALVRRKLAPKGATDLADVRRILLGHPELRQDEGDVAMAIRLAGGVDAELRQWRALLAEPAVTDEETDASY